MNLLNFLNFCSMSLPPVGMLDDRMKNVPYEQNAMAIVQSCNTLNRL